MRKLTLLLLAPAVLLSACKETPPAAADGAMPDRVELSGQLSQQDALTAMNENIPSLVPCTKTGTPSGPIDLQLSWSVLPDGTVNKIDIKATGGSLDDAVRTCIAEAMAKWVFPASKTATRIEAITMRLGG